MKNKLSISLLLILILFSASIQGQYLNQAGYEKYSVKRIFFDQQHQKTDYTILGQNEEKVFEGKTTTARNWEYSGSKICMADFSELRIPGQYKLILKNDNTDPVYFQISPGIYKKTGKMILKSFYHARASVATLEKHAGIYHRSAGHPDTTIYIHRSAASENRPEGATFSSPGGWYDAGDYNKYIVNSAISTFTLLHAYEMYYKQLKQVKVNIPESSNNIPDIIDETLYNLRWMISMQDPFDGGVYHKLTSKTFCGMVMPHEDELKRYVVMKTTAATLDFAATMAKASRVLKDFDTLKPLADSCKYAAEKAWKWSVKNPDVTYIQPDDIMTGQYDDKYLDDEWYWAATELYLTTKNDNYKDHKFAKQTQFKIPQWGRVNSLGLYSLLSLPENNKRYKMAADKIISLSNQYYANYRHSPMGISLKEFPWGSNSELANHGILFLMAYRISGDKKFLNAADACAGYILGANLTGYCFITGLGSNYPMHVHERRSSADGIKEPVPGMVIGGPSLQATNDCGKSSYPSSYPALSYIDDECSYSTNETAINWNAAGTFLFLGLSSEYATIKTMKDE